MDGFDHDPGIMAAVRRASRARLIRFLEFCEPADVRALWAKGLRAHPETDPDFALRASAFVLASHFWQVRRRDREIRDMQTRVRQDRPQGLKLGTVPSYRGAALDAWRAMQTAPGRQAPLPLAAE